MIRFEDVSLDFPLLSNKAHLGDSKGMAGRRVGGAINSLGHGRVSVRALENISFTLNSGDKLALMGHNGAGKNDIIASNGWPL